MLEIKDLHAKTGDTPILNGLSLTINPGEVHAVMGPNGSGKSTLSKIITGHPDYEVTSGEILFKGENLLELDPDERALKGIFMSFQYPVEIPGVNNESFLRMIYNAKRRSQGLEEVDPFDFDELIQSKLNWLRMNPELLNRSINHGFSGGEKKRNEILQMAILDPCFTILDEVDSGLDIDALKDVAQAANALRRPDNSFLVITHYQRLLNYIVPDVVHIMAGGKLIKTGDKSLALKVEEQGYDWLLEAVKP